MSVTAISDRTRPAPKVRRFAPAPPPTVTVTVELHLTGDGLPPGAARLMEAVRDLASELGDGAVRVRPPAWPPHPHPPHPSWPARSVAAVPDPPRPADPQPPAAGDLADRVDGVLYVHPAARSVICDGRQLRLTRLEFDLLLFLAEHPGHVFRRDELLRRVWGYDQTGVRTVDVHVRRLRVKLGTPRPLVATVHGVGYRLDDRARIQVLREPA
jgi:two-component system, OmpR family, response regulator